VDCQQTCPGLCPQHTRPGQGMVPKKKKKKDRWFWVICSQRVRVVSEGYKRSMAGLRVSVNSLSSFLRVALAMNKFGRMRVMNKKKKKIFRRQRLRERIFFFLCFLAFWPGVLRVRPFRGVAFALGPEAVGCQSCILCARRPTGKICFPLDDHSRTEHISGTASQLSCVFFLLLGDLHPFDPNPHVQTHTHPQSSINPNSRPL